MEDVNVLFANNTLRVLENLIRQFIALGVLSLCAASFISTGVKTPDSSESFDYETFQSRKIQAAEQISSVFYFSIIRLLKLRFRPGWEELLDLLTVYPRPIRLMSLEI
jgi:16S rRNA U1498 N3-methylase RsmE